jgi:hypothetical protein
VWEEPTPATGPPSLGELLQRGDLDGLVREVDRLAAIADWDGLLVLRERCHAAAHELGKQLWGPAQYAEYRLALHGPGPLAGAVVTPGAARFALGPLTEVVAQEHSFAELADHLDVVVAAVVAQERVLRGEDLRDDPRAALELAGLPGVLQPWEPDYTLPTYRPNERIDGSPQLHAGEAQPAATPPGRPRPAGPLERALSELVAPWVSASEGEVHVVSVDGDAAAAVAAVVVGTAHLRRIGSGDAMAAMAWAAASGGARGRRRGGAAGRAAAWWVAQVATGVLDPDDPDELEYHLEELRWYLVDTDVPAVGSLTPTPPAGDADQTPDGDAAATSTGWHLHLAVEHPGEGWAAAIDATDTPPLDRADDEEGHL